MRGKGSGVGVRGQELRVRVWVTGIRDWVRVRVRVTEGLPDMTM